MVLSFYNPYTNRIQTLTIFWLSVDTMVLYKNKRYEVAFQEDLESGRLEKVVDSIRFEKNGNINKKKLSEHSRSTDKTILNLSI